MRVACALRIIRGKNIYNFAILENLRIFQNCLFTGGVVKANGSCSACFLRKRGAAISILSLSVIAARCHRLRGFARRGRKSKNREASQNFPVDSYNIILYYSERSSSWQYSTMWWNICSTAGAMEAGRCTAKPTTRYSSGSMGYTLTAALQSRSSI